jgi:hypothetical protein
MILLWVDSSELRLSNKYIFLNLMLSSSRFFLIFPFHRNLASSHIKTFCCVGIWNLCTIDGDWFLSNLLVCEVNMYRFWFVDLTFPVSISYAIGTGGKSAGIMPRLRKLATIHSLLPCMASWRCIYIRKHRGTLPYIFNCVFICIVDSCVRFRAMRTWFEELSDSIIQ